MGVKIKGIKEAQRRLDAVVEDVRTRKAVRAIKSAMFIIGAESALMTPMDTGTLVNSQFQETIINGTRITGRIGYSANYAVYVHNASGIMKGLPRPNNRGNYWDPSGEPKFLTKAAEKTRRQVDDIIRKEMKL
ncbi:phage protein, HK97 gp10 family [Serratia liquefaciens]|uniref:HK97 gp10 family phage protein n=1 Tax=Serratia liquefaciens TaxID=614 RepID=UPI0021780181|nr:HK97 gp10 family phage protein [Serratia liquefaciens]CAI1254859.1 phage protein, HK97 gp10 family [Serratia liquefaciens]CAI1846508.1 phage protein, HK97 gp10 family [Serratia liquefaciens]